MLQTPGVD